MCGYLQRNTGAHDFKKMLEPYGLGDHFKVERGEAKSLQHFLPAFAQRGERKIPDVVIQEGGERKLVDATWWYDCKEKDGHLIPSGTHSFNARRLHLPMWKEAIESRRGVAIMTGIGESRKVDGKKTSNHYLMVADRPFFIGVLYDAFPHNLFSAAVITRDKQIGFDKYHDKAFPLFLPYDTEFIDLWLNPDIPSSHYKIENLLTHPTWFTELHVTRVKTFSGGETYKDSVTETLKLV